MPGDCSDAPQTSQRDQVHVKLTIAKTQLVLYSELAGCLRFKEPAAWPQVVFPASGQKALCRGCVVTLVDAECRMFEVSLVLDGILAQYVGYDSRSDFLGEVSRVAETHSSSGASLQVALCDLSCNSTVLVSFTRGASLQAGESAEHHFLKTSHLGNHRRKVAIIMLMFVGAVL